MNITAGMDDRGRQSCLAAELDEQMKPAAAPVDLYRQLFEAAMNTANAAMEYVQRNQEKFNAKAGDDKLEIICREFLRAQVQSTPAAPGIDLSAIKLLILAWRHMEGGNGSMASQNRKDVFRRCANDLEKALSRIDASPKGGSDAVDAELWRFCNGKHQIDDAERIECHVIVGVNVWRGDEWLSFHQGSPEEVRAALQATSAEVGP